MTCTNVTGGPSGVPSAAKRVTVCTSYCVNAPTVERRPLGELAEAAAQDAAPFGQHADRHADARRVVHAARRRRRDPTRMPELEHRGDR